jgi:PAS domain-containing protein
MIDEVKDITKDLLVIPEQRVHFKTVLEKNHTISNFIYEAKTKQNNRKQISLTARLVATDGGDLFYEGFLIDVTEQHETKSRFERLLRDVQGMAFRCEPKPPWRMLWLSEGCGELTGYSKEDLMSDRPNYDTLIDEEYRDEVATAIALAISRKTTYTLYYPIRTASDDKKWVLEKGKVVWDNKDGKPMYLDGFVTSANHVSNVKSRDIQEVEVREEFQKMRFRVVLLWTFLIQFIVINLTVALVLVLKTFDFAKSISEEVVIGLIGQLVAQVAGFVYLIIKSVFPVKDKGGDGKQPDPTILTTSASALTPPILQEEEEDNDRPPPSEFAPDDEDANKGERKKTKLPKKG